MELIELQTIWWLLVGVLFIIYAILDGFDLGIGVLHLFARNEEERELHIAAVGPVWDGNEVWLITAGGALFAAFPVAYATSFSTFYLALTLVLFSLMGRALGIEFREQVKSAVWKRFWDYAFGLGSSMMLILLGVAFGNIMKGLAIVKTGRGFVFQGSFFDLLNPYALMIGIVVLVYFVMHGALWLAMKTEGRLQRRVSRWAQRCWTLSVALYLLSAIATWMVSPHLMRTAADRSAIFWPLVALLILTLALIPLWLKSKSYLLAFLSSSGAIVAMMGLAGLGLFPVLVPSSLDPAGASLTMTNASGKADNLSAMLVITAIGLPLVIVYHIVAYWIFRGKADASHGYASG